MAWSDAAREFLARMAALGRVPADPQPWRSAHLTLPAMLRLGELAHVQWQVEEEGDHLIELRIGGHGAEWQPVPALGSQELRMPCADLDVELRVGPMLAQHGRIQLLRQPASWRIFPGTTQNVGWGQTAVFDLYCEDAAEIRLRKPGLDWQELDQRCRLAMPNLKVRRELELAIRGTDGLWQRTTLTAIPELMPAARHERVFARLRGNPA